MKINWFSPLPPARTDIGHYTARLLPALSKYFEVTIWACQDEWDTNLEQFATIHRWSGDAWSALNQGDATFYNIGNNPLFHQDIWEASCRYPGIVVLHDLRLHDLFLGIHFYIRGEREYYKQLLAHYYGADGLRDARQFFEGQLAPTVLSERYPLTEYALENACGALVHTQEAHTTLAAYNHWPTGYLPLPYPCNPLTPRLQPDPATPRRLIVFGYLGKNRQLDKVLSALAALPERQHFRLNIYGQMDDPEHITAQIREHKLGDIVHVHGFVPEVELDQALDQADLAINLRFPSMGEASGSQLRIWDHALPSLVTQTGWYATLSESTVAFVRPDHEVEDLQIRLHELLDDPERFRQMGQEGRHLLETQHSPEQYALALRELIPIAQDHRCLGLMDGLIDRLRGEMEFFSYPDSPESLHRIATEIHNLAAPRHHS